MSAGLIAKWVSRYRMWQKKFSSWKNFCLYGLGKDPWKIKRLIENSEIMVYLAKQGFEVLPQNPSQVEKLHQCAKKLGCLIEEAWSKVVSQLPEQLITADTIAETLGFPSMNVNKRMERKLANHLEDVASERGLTLNEMLKQDYGLDAEEAELEDNQTDEPTDEAMAIWSTDLAELVAEHDQEIWLLATLTKLANFVTRSTSQFSWLHQYRCQT